MTIFALIKNETTYISYDDNFNYPDGIPVGAVEISAVRNSELIDGINCKQQYVWQDKQGKFHLRDRFTKYDETTDTWIVDQDAIDKDTKQQLINSANLAYNDGMKYGSGYLWNKLTTEQQQELTTYLDALNDIIDETDTKSTELPNKPNFIK